MKYRVIGWTDYDYSNVPDSRKQIGFAERNAIIDEIRKHKYLFSGYSHQERYNCVPVLNDGRGRSFSQRGWGSVMAEAYNKIGDFDYASYTFSQSIDYEDEKCPDFDEIFFEKDFVPEVIENEHFDIEVNEKLFEIAKTSNPFYLEDVNKLRYIDEDDTITLHHNGESLTFLVEDIDRCATESKFSKDDIIKGKYQITVKHKPIDKKKKFQKTCIFISNDKKEEVLNQCFKSYDFNTALNWFELCNPEDYENDENEEELLKLTKTFVNDLIKYSFDYKFIVNYLDFIYDFDLFKDIAYKVKDEDPSVMLAFFNTFLDTKYIEECILENIDIIKCYAYDCPKLILRAIDLKRDDIELRYKFYNEYEYHMYRPFVLFGADIFEGLSKEDQFYLKIVDYKQLTCNGIRKCLEVLLYPDYDISTDKRYGFRNIDFENANDCVIEGVNKYKEYVKSKIDLDSIMEEMIIFAVGDCFKDVENILDGYDREASIIYSLDALTKFKYNLKEIAIKNHSEKHPKIIEELNDIYSK